MGFGGGSVLIMYLTLVLNMPQKEAQGINLVFFLPCAFVSAVYYIKKGMVNFREILPCAVVGSVGSVAGFALLQFIPGNMAAKLFGGFLLLLGVKELVVAFQGK